MVSVDGSLLAGCAAVGPSTVGLTVGESCKETHSILPDDPCSAMSECSWHAQQSRHGWKVDIYSQLKVTCDEEYFYLNRSIKALENGIQVHQSESQEKLSRGFS